MKKFIALVLVLVLISVTFIGCGDSSKTEKANSSSETKDNSNTEENSEEVSSDEPIVIGLIEAMTGEKAMSGMYAKEGAEMFLEDINAKGGVLGREVKIVFEDDQGNETVGTNAYQKLVSENNVSGVVLSKFSSVVLAMEPFIQEEQIPAIAMGSSTRIADSENEWLYSARKSDEGSSYSIAKVADETLGMTKVAIIHAPDALGTGMAPIVQAELEKRGIEVISVQQFGSDEKNFAPYIAKIINTDFDGIISMAQQTEAALIMKAIDEAGIDVPRIGSSAFCQQTAIQNAGTSANGWYSVTAWSPATSEEPAKTWIERYKEKYGQDPDMGSALTYDALTVFAHAIELAGTDDPIAVNEELSKLTDVQGIGSTYAKQDGTRMIARSEFLAQIQDEVSTVIDTVYS